MYNIEKKKVPMPKARAPAGRYPFDNMDIGESFFIEPENGVSIDQLQRRVSTAAYRAKYIFGKTFTTRRMDGGVRCWMIE